MPLEYEGRDIKTFKVVDLKAALTTLGLSIKGLKADLLKRLTEHLETEAAAASSSASSSSSAMDIDDDEPKPASKPASRASSPKKSAQEKADSKADAKDDDDAADKSGDEDDADEHIEEDTTQDPIVVIANLRYLLTLSDEDVSAARKQEVKEQMMTMMTERKMAPYYETVCAEFGWTVDTSLVKTWNAANTAAVVAIDAQIADHKINAGDTEVRDAMVARAQHYADIGDKTTALSEFDTVYGKTVGSGNKIDVVFACIRIGLMHFDNDVVKTHVAKAKTLVASGGDWERRNLLKVYEAVYHVITRDFHAAALLFTESVSTFTCYQLVDYETFVMYAVLTALVSLDRVTLKKQVIDNAEVLSVIRDVPHLRPLLMSLYQCDYAGFFAALDAISSQIRTDRYLAPHTAYFLREVRVVAYTQFLQSYRSVTLESMATSFGVSTAFLDAELARFIAGGRLNAKVDKVGGVVVTRRPDTRNAQYAQLIKQGDSLLNLVQKLTKVVSY